MAPFKDEQIIIIAPGSQTTLAQLGLPESFTPARVRIRSCMFSGEKEGEWEPYKVRRKEKAPNGQENGTATNGQNGTDRKEEEVEYEEDFVSDEGAVWPMTEGRITNWACFFALIQHVYNNLNPPFHTPILLISQPCWTDHDCQKLTQFFFEKFKMPAFALMDAATATCYAYGVPSATVVDVGLGKADVTAVSEFLLHDTGRAIAVPKCGGEAMTQRLLELLSPKGFTREMCEQLKKSSIAEILPPGTPLPGASGAGGGDVTNPAAAASTGAQGSGPNQRNTAGAMGEAPLGPGPGTEVGEEANNDDENEGVLDVASIVAGGKMTEYLARKEKEKAEKAVTKKKGAAEASAAQQKQGKLPNWKKERATFLYEDHHLLDTLKGMNLSGKEMAEAQVALDEGGQKRTAPRREVEVGVERFQAATGGIIERLADAIYRTVSSVEQVAKRSELWDSLIIVGNGARVRGFKDTLIATLNSKYIISPSSATIFTSELPSNLSTPAGTGANTPQPQLGGHTSHGVNPLLLAATTAHNQHLTPGNAIPSVNQQQNVHSSHGQTPTSIKLAKVPEYFPEWKDVGYDEAAFLGAQVAAKVLFIVDQGLSKGFMTRTDYNDQGPTGIMEFKL
ncbi:hypothetical protein NA57DRAFT_58211 [Rhizodiscina lignyota]|uniref:Actin-like ATPase domain-containing protein n=1 Tax=Rhizodiscina lignyota TaxID=1504668 RepID=A0A9P4I9F7_9PEZI|nr:hypothetical protein NA57DRAFT_58211 [Rhizodiscina lignyota]